MGMSVIIRRSNFVNKKLERIKGGDTNSFLSFFFPKISLILQPDSNIVEKKAWSLGTSELFNDGI